MGDFLLVLDHGTTGVKSCVMDRQGKFVARAYAKFQQYYPQPAWVEHDPVTLWNLTLQTARDALKTAGIGWGDVHALGLSNQRETTILWDGDTGEPVCKAIVWQCRRTEELCNQLKVAGIEESIRAKTGLVLDPYFSGSKIRWILEKYPRARELRDQGRLRFGTVDTWIAWNLSGRKNHVTDPSNASRTLLYDIHRRQWDDDLMGFFGVTAEMLPGTGGVAQMDPTFTGGYEIPISALVGDQQAALFGQRCWYQGDVKSTFGTGTFVVANLGGNVPTIPGGLLLTIAYTAEGAPCYALEGSVFLSGGILEWLQREMGVIEDGRQADQLASTLETNEGVYLVPALAGLGAPHWRADARGVLCGLSQASGRAHLARAALESIAYQAKEVVDIISELLPSGLDKLKVDGGLTNSHFLMQFLADILETPVQRLDSPDITARGAGMLAGLRSGFWSTSEELKALPAQRELFQSQMAAPTREHLLAGWEKALERALL